MSAAEFRALLPLAVIAGTAVVTMLGIALRRRHDQTAAIALAGLAAAFGSLWIAAGGAPHTIQPLLVVDRYALFYMGLIFAASAAFVFLSYDYLQKCEGDHEEVYVLMLVATLGAAVLVASSHLISLFLGLELLSVSLYGMISYLRTRPLPLEAGLKYLVLAAVSSAFLLFGIALIYAALGTMELPRIAGLMLGAGFDQRLVFSGLTLVITGLGFKLAVVPFHLWTPDVYEGAPAPVTAYIATVSKGAIFAALLRYFQGARLVEVPSLFLLFSAIAVVSMIAGNLLALLQDNLKRILAYSSIAHLGYLLVAFLAGGSLAVVAVAFYLVAYFVTTLGAFGVISILSNGEKGPATIATYRGLFWRRPVLAAIFTVMLLSFAGIPMTAGFLAKFYVIAAGASSAKWTLVLTLAITSAVGLYYYLRVVVALYAEREELAPPEPSVGAVASLLLAVLTSLLVWFGVVPGALLGLIRTVVAS